MNDQTIWEFNQTLSRRLFSWNLINILTGIWLTRRGGFWRGIGSQSIGWGIINMAIAIFGSQATARRHDRLDNPDAPKILTRESRNLRWILGINAGLDILYMYGGWRLVRGRGLKNTSLRGVGSGIILQGLLLFIFDTTQAQQVPTATKPEKMG
jgi:hypothetical protein